jgi:ubiquinone/menaquinone biosynthesis C-methylase UbiE
MKRPALLAVFVAAATLWQPLAAQKPASKDAPDYEFRQDHDPNGIGKFYMGREIAQVMGHQAADWLDRPEREEEERISLLLRLLKLRPGQSVVDLGAGSGTLTFPMAKMVAPKGKVYAVEIQQEMLDIIDKRMKERGVTNIVKVLGDIKDPRLPPASADLILLVDVYHEFDYPYEMTTNMVKALKPGGRLVFVEYRKEDPDVPIKEVHKMSVAQVKKEMGLFPSLKFDELISKLPRQHVIIFKKVAAQTRRPQ